MIALLGRWGTGKSSIVHQFEKRLANEHSGKYIIFKYDAWAHQGDPSRRSILEELISFLIGKRLTRLKTWKETFQEISGEREDSTTRKQSKLTWLAKVLLVLLLPLPFLISLLDFDVLTAVFSDKPSGVGRAILIATLLYLLLMISIFPVSFLATRKWKSLAADEKFGVRIQHFWQSGPDILSLILTRNTEDSSSTTVRKPQPTTIEFRRILRRIIRSQKSSRLVFVVDNLDRIDPLEALGIWSVMVGLVADETHRVSPEKEPLLIVPLDKQALSELVKAQHNTGFDSDQLIEKSFDVIFEVPPPVLSDWRAFLERQFRFVELADRESFARELYWVGQYFEQWCRARDDGRITPRRINRFLNQLVSLQAQSADRVSPSLLAYYVANRTKADADILALLSTEKPGSEIGNEWQTQLAAVHFGVRADDAAQVVLGDELRRALDESEQKTFDRARGVRGFDGVLERYIETPPKTTAGLADAAPLLTLASYLAAARDGISQMVWDRLWVAIQGSDGVNVQPAVVTKAVEALIGCVSASLITNGADALLSIVVTAIDKSTDEKELATLVEAGSSIVAAVGEKAGRLPIADINLALKILKHSDDDAAFLKVTKCEATYAEVAARLIDEMATTSSWAVPGRAALVGREPAAQIFQGERSEFYTNLVAGIGETLRSEEAPAAAKTAAIRLYAERVHAEPEFKELADELKADDTINELTDLAISNPKVPLLGPITALRLTYDVGFDDENAAQAHSKLLEPVDVARSVLINIRAMNDRSFLPLFKSFDESSSNLFELLPPLLRHAVVSGNIGHWVDSKWMIKNFASFRAWLTESQARSLASLMVQIENFEEKILTSEEGAFADYINYLDKAQATDLLVKRLSSFSVDDWKELITGQSPLWSRIGGAKMPLLEPQRKSSTLHDALTAILNGPTGSIGYHGVLRVAKLLPWLNDQSRVDVLRAGLRATVERGDTDLFLLLAKNDHFRSEASRRPFLRDALITLFDPLSRSGAGRTFIERNIDALRGTETSLLTKVQWRLGRAIRSREASVREWAAFVRDKLS
nr:P-loop NTPase fold protein [Sphingomonas anseongensis]